MLGMALHMRAYSWQGCALGQLFDLALKKIPGREKASTYMLCIPSPATENEEVLFSRLHYEDIIVWLRVRSLELPNLCW